MSAEQKRILTLAAERSGMNLSTFLRSLGLQKARELGVDGAG
jgi:uncharacterized protein (DUF1778 family)